MSCSVPAECPLRSLPLFAAPVAAYVPWRLVSRGGIRRRSSTDTGVDRLSLGFSETLNDYQSVAGLG
jgi:hypothetical protein